MKVGNIHPLMRQYVSVIVSKIYFSSSELQDEYREIFMNWITNNKIDLNSFVPVILLLGYEMLR